MNTLVRQLRECGYGLPMGYTTLAHKAADIIEQHEQRIAELEAENRLNAEHNLDLKRQRRMLAVDQLADTKRIAELENEIDKAELAYNTAMCRIAELEAELAEFKILLTRIYNYGAPKEDKP